MITKHTQLLNYLIDRYGLKSYCEIGVQTPEQNYNKINLPVHAKVGVDPCLVGYKDNLVPVDSDTFFASQKDKFDIFFIDGLHHADQVRRDFENSLACLNDGGFIVLHDTCPDEEQYTIVPRQTKKWFGDVYKFAMGLCWYNDISYCTIDVDCGITIVWKQLNSPGITTPLEAEPTWEDYQHMNKYWLKIIPVENLEQSLPLRKMVV